MIEKTLFLMAILLESVGLPEFANKFNDAIIRDQSGSEQVVQAEDYSFVLPNIVSRPKVKPGSERPFVYAKYYLLADLESSEVFIKNDYKTEAPIASTTKIMTAVVVLDNYRLDDVVTVSAEAAYQIGADTYLRVGEKITVESLLNCLLVKSGNDSAYALAEHMNNQNETGITKFIEKMNEKALELGMKNTHYEDPAGLDVTGYSSAYDLFLLTKYALQKEIFRDIVKKDKETVKNVDGTIWHQLDQSNRLVGEYKYPGAIGVKTGYMPEAGHCLVGAAEREGHTLIAIVLATSADTPSASADESKKLLDWGFRNIEWQ